MTGLCRRVCDGPGMSLSMIEALSTSGTAGPGGGPSRPIEGSDSVSVMALFAFPHPLIMFLPSMLGFFPGLLQPLVLIPGFTQLFPGFTQLMGFLVGRPTRSHRPSTPPMGEQNEMVSLVTTDTLEPECVVSDTVERSLVWSCIGFGVLYTWAGVKNVVRLWVRGVVTSGSVLVKSMGGMGGESGVMVVWSCRGEIGEMIGADLVLSVIGVDVCGVSRSEDCCCGD